MVFGWLVAEGSVTCIRQVRSVNPSLMPGTTGTERGSVSSAVLFTSSSSSSSSSSYRVSNFNTVSGHRLFECMLGYLGVSIIYRVPSDTD